MLYTINKSPFEERNLESALRIAPQGTPILFYEDGVYAAAKGTQFEPLVRAALLAHPIFALDADLKARGVARTVEGVQVIGYDGFVELVEAHLVVPWL
jgi:tRNA 2-thiouridine synthesizing protein B